MKIVFAGTSEFAIPSLEALVEVGHDVALVVTQADRPIGRGRHIGQTPVKESALSLGLELFQPERISSPESLERLFSIGDIDVFVVVAYGQKIPKSLLEWPRLKVVNVHGSILPQYRGAAPIQQAIIDGCKSTGVTTMLMDEGWDTGAILLQDGFDINPDENADELSRRLAKIGAKLLVRTLDMLQDGKLEPIPQDNSQATYAYSLKRDAGAIDWRMTARQIVNRIHGCTPKPGAFANLGDYQIKLWASAAVSEQCNDEPGVIVAVDADGVKVATGSGIVLLQELQPESRKRMLAAEWARGSKIVPGTSFVKQTIIK